MWSSLHLEEYVPCFCGKLVNADPESRPCVMARYIPKLTKQNKTAPVTAF